MAIMRKKSGKTPTGSAINELAQRLRRQDRSLSFEDAKMTAREQIKAKDALVSRQAKLRESLELGIGGKYKRAVFRGLLGQNLGDKVSSLIRSKSQDQSTSDKLLDIQDKLNPKESKQEKNSTYENLSKSSEYKTILKKLISIEAEVKSIKAVKIADPEKKKPEEPILKSPHHEDASAGLMALGYKKAEVDEMLKNAKGANAGDIIKDALKKKNHEKIPVQEVPQAVDKVKAEITPQAEAAEAKVETEHKTEVIEDKKEKKKILEELESIKKKVSGGGLLTLLGALIGALLIKYYKPIMEFLEPIGAFIKKVWDGFIKPAIDMLGKFGQWIGDKLHLGDTGSATLETEASVQPMEVANHIAGINERLKGTGYELKGAGKYTTPEGKTVGVTELPDSIRDKVDRNWRGKGVAPTTKPMATPIAAVATAPASQAAMRVNSVSTQNADLRADAAAEPAPVIINAPTTNVVPPAQSSGGGDILISTRNSEPSQESYIGSLFNHPAVRLPM